MGMCMKTTKTTINEATSAGRDARTIAGESGTACCCCCSGGRAGAGVAIALGGIALFAPAHIFNRVPPQPITIDIDQVEHVRQWQRRGQQITISNRAMNMKTLVARCHAYKSTPARGVHVSRVLLIVRRVRQHWSTTRTLPKKSGVPLRSVPVRE